MHGAPTTEDTTGKGGCTFGPRPPLEGEKGGELKSGVAPEEAHRHPRARGAGAQYPHVGNVVTA